MAKSENPKLIRCDFCAGDYVKDRKTFQGPKNVAICHDCVDLAMRSITEAYRILAEPKKQSRVSVLVSRMVRNIRPKRLDPSEPFNV